MLFSRRIAMASVASLVASFSSRAAAALDARTASFVEAAFRMKRDAVQAGDQPYGAIVVRGSEIVGYGPSRVIAKGDDTAHAEREAIRDAQRKLGADLTGCLMYSTSRPCPSCEAAAAQTNIARMYFGERATDAGSPHAR
jgi:tRNA(adenine34) deaminase